MGRGYVGANVIAELDIDYQYLGHDYDDPNDFTNLLEVNLLFAKDTSNYSTNIAHIMKQAEEYAKSFVKQNLTWDTGRLHDSIIAEDRGNMWTLHAPARDEHDHLYAGHIEYGFTDKAGQAHGPWPFLRPAVRLAAMDSRGELADALAYNMLYGSVINGSTPWKIGFGRSGASFSKEKGVQSFKNMSKAHQRYDAKNNKTIEWGKAKNGFNDYGGRFDKGTSSNRWSTGTSEFWDWGEL